MCRIPFTIRIKGRYAFRRRIHFRNIISKPLSWALQTADPGAARERAAILSARFVIVKADVKTMLEGQRNLTGVEIEAIFRRELERQLGSWLSAAYENGPWSSSVTEEAARHGEAYRKLRLPDQRYDMDPFEVARLDAARSARVENDVTPEWARPVVDQIREALSDDYVSDALKAIGATSSEPNIAAARTHLIRAGASACARAQRVFDDDVLDAADPMRAMTADLGELPPAVSALLAQAESVAAPIAQTIPPSPAPPSECPFATYDNRRFSEIIEDVLVELKQDKIWKGDLKQQRRIMQPFAWITGDRELGSYDHRDVAQFKNGLKRLPTTFRFGNPAKGAMSRPFAEVIDEIDRITPATARNLKTVNRDLSTMSTVAKHLALTSWKPRLHNTLIMDFAGATVAIQEDKNTELRPPWKKEELECLFRSPLYQGGGAGKNRLKAGSVTLRVWHDAAYWAPLIWYYTHACREEICGLEVADVFVDHPVPHIFIRENFTRGRDGEKAGEKRIARRRKLPLHGEIIRPLTTQVI